MSKPVKKVGKAIKKGLRSFDRQVGFTKQKELLSAGVKQIAGVPKIQQEEAATQPAAAVGRQAVRPLAALGTPSTENQEAATRDLYRRRRARGVATSPTGLTGEASVRRKTLLGG